MVRAAAALSAILALLFAPVTLAVAAQSGATPPPAIASPLARDHPLVGRVWSVRDERFVSAEELAAATTTATATLVEADIVLLGEVHDNVDHHAWQAWLLDAILRVHRVVYSNAAPGAVVLEHIRSDQQSTVASFEAKRAAGEPVTSADLFDALGWENTGWPNRDIFAPLFESALKWNMPILAGDAPRAVVRAVGKTGPEVLEAGERARLALEEELAPGLRRDLLQEIQESHCGLIPESAVEGMALAQRYRDAHLAVAAAKAAVPHGSFLVAGNGHVRRDRGVPWHLARIAPRLSVASVLMVEVEDGKIEPESYGVRGPDDVAAADFIVFTPRADRDDACEAWRARASQPAK